MKKDNLLRFIKFVLIILMWGFYFNCLAAIPHLLNYQGRLTDRDNRLLEGAYNLTFRIYDAETAGNLLWEETQSAVVIQKGIFSILLGSINNLNLAFDKPYYLEIKVGDEVMSPRQQITSAGYAIMAGDVLSVPKGVIVMWSGTIADIPSGWALCDGTNGTPDLRDRFIVGARQDEDGVAKTNVTGLLTQSGDGQIPAHSHEKGTLTVDSAGAHSHVISTNWAGGSSPTPLGAKDYWNTMFPAGPGTTLSTKANGAHVHPLSGATSDEGTGTKNIAVYYALAFIMKM